MLSVETLICIATTAVKYAKSSFETKLAKDIQQNPTLFWKYVRNRTKVWHDLDKANNVLGTVKWTSITRDAAVIWLLYTTLVRPILDYSSTI